MTMQVQAAGRVASEAVHAKVGLKVSATLPGAEARRVIAEDEALMSPSYTRGYPLVVKSGKGCRIEDVDGNEFLDFTAGIAVNSTGHCHPEVVEAVREQAGRLLHMSGTDFYYELMPKVAAKLVGDCADGGAAPGVFWQLGRRGGGVRAEAGAVSHGAAAGDQFSGELSWEDDGGAVADGVEGAAEAAVWAVCAGGDACAVSVCVPRVQRRARRPKRRLGWGVQGLSRRSCSRRRCRRRRWRRFLSSRFRGRVGILCRRMCFWRRFGGFAIGTGF